MNEGKLRGRKGWRENGREERGERGREEGGRKVVQQIKVKAKDG